MLGPRKAVRSDLVDELDSTEHCIGPTEVDREVSARRAGVVVGLRQHGEVRGSGPRSDGQDEAGRTEEEGRSRGRAEGPGRIGRVGWTDPGWTWSMGLDSTGIVLDRRRLDRRRRVGPRVGGSRPSPPRDGNPGPHRPQAPGGGPKRIYFRDPTRRDHSNL
ncbi:hypothetical protein TNIN_309131 [Trichonephila inaurata madagascariensis]|uniref:Uncharacterized protein n=1 Tax=Trichonephila inaurata madagascariensis TaxID=2747483 RepID=A0A8X6YBJ0_9ARAC|nr:hypothetical protein TNIN_309131 [Trichonephila inaurata madagascariensis]